MMTRKAFMMTRKAFLLALTAPFVARFFPKPKAAEIRQARLVCDALIALQDQLNAIYNMRIETSLWQSSNRIDFISARDFRLPLHKA